MKKYLLSIPLFFALTLIAPSVVPAVFAAQHAPTEKEKTLAGILIKPQTISQHTSSVLLLGSGWGKFDDRGEPFAVIAPKEDTSQLAPLTIEANYRDCTFFTTGGECVMDEDDLMMRVALPKNLAEGTYLIYVTTKNNFEGYANLSVAALPDFTQSNRPIIGIRPSSGPTGTPVLLAVGGFPKRTGLFVRFDGVKLPGILYTDDAGAVLEYSFSIPSTITKGTKIISITPGKHTIEVNDGAGLFQTVAFTVTGKEEPKKEEPKKEEPKKEEPKKEEPKKEEPKKEEPKKEIVTDPGTPFLGKTCDPKLPRVWQEGCVDPGAKKEAPAVQLYVPDSHGKPCRADRAITFQPGCISQEKMSEPTKPFAGKMCDPNLPRVWQEGCIDTKEKPATKVAVYVPDSQGKPCKEEIAITFQPGCIAQEKKIHTGTTAEGEKYCNPNIPTYSQPGCVAQNHDTSPTSATPHGSSPTEQKASTSEKPFSGKPCDSKLPRRWQEGCVTKQTETDTRKRVESTKKVDVKKIEPVKLEKDSSSSSKTQKDYNETYQKSIQWDAYKRTLNLGSGIY